MIQKGNDRTIVYLNYLEIYSNSLPYFHKLTSVLLSLETIPITNLCSTRQRRFNEL